jgi:type II secretory pathway pseudopilin PulG
MGQQQLLLVILVTIIVGIATVVAINTFGSAAGNANVSAVRNDVAQIASSVQGMYRKPAVLGGAGQDFGNVTFKGMAFSSTLISSDGKDAVNQNGTYELSAGTDSSLTITAYPASSDGYNGKPGTGKTHAGAKIATAGKRLVYLVTKNSFTEQGDDYGGTDSGDGN